MIDEDYKKITPGGLTSYYVMVSISHSEDVKSPQIVGL